MDARQFDTITRLFASRRLSRRAALLAGAGLAMASVSGAVAQATPEAEEGKKVAFMFVQTFGGGSLAPAGSDGLLTFTADHLAAQTLYFSDRPERIVGMVPTETFLGSGPTGNSGFSEIDPPNAALVFSAADGKGEIVVLELIDPAFDPATGTVTYTVRVLEEVESVDLALESMPLSAAAAPRDFEAASLFIDDCPDGNVICYTADGSGIIGSYPTDGGNMGYCYDWSEGCCLPCQAPPTGGDWGTSCNALYDSCGDSCTYQYNAGWACEANNGGGGGLS